MNLTEAISLPTEVGPGEFFLDHFAGLNRIAQEIKVKILQLASLLQGVVQSPDIAEDGTCVFVKNRHGDRSGRKRSGRVQCIGNLERLMPFREDQKSDKGLGKPKGESGK
jgi:hypothetical protein